MRLADCIQQWQTSMQSALGAQIDLSSQGPLGQLGGVTAAMAASLWAQLEGVYMSQYPDTAEGQSLDNCRSLNNIPRLPSIPSVVAETITAAQGTVINGTDTSPTPFQMSVTGTNHGVVFQATKTLTVGAGGSVQMPMACTVNGPFPASAGTLTVIETPTAGVTSATNASDAVVGRVFEIDPTYRLRSLQELQLSQAGTVEGIRNTLLKNVAVTQAGVEENITNVTDANSLLPHSFEAFAEGGSDAEVAKSVWLSKPAGIATDGSSSSVVTDSMGNNHTIQFQRPTTVPIYLDVQITLDTDSVDGEPYPADGDTEVSNALVSYLSTFVTGQNVINAKLIQAVMDAVSGIATIQIFQDVAPAPGASTNIVIPFNSLATLTSANIDVDS